MDISVIRYVNFASFFPPLILVPFSLIPCSSIKERKSICLSLSAFAIFFFHLPNAPNSRPSLELWGRSTIFYPWQSSEKISIISCMNDQENMESSNRTFLPLSRFSYLHDVESRGKSEGLNHHQRCSSESYLIEEQPLWLDDLLNDPDTDFLRGHRRAASDSYAYLGEAAVTFAKGDESKFVNAYFGMSAISQNLANQDETSGNSVAQKTNQGMEEGLSSLSVENSREESSTQNSEGSSDKAVGSQVKNSATKTESKRSNKQHNAHRSRVRKLQYIAHLERSLEILKAEGAEVSAEIEFVEQQNIILTMENRALKQRLESLSQEQIIKHWEQEMLEREIGRLQSGYHLQKQQQMQMHYQQQQQQLHNQHAKQRRNRCREIDQVNNAAIKNKDAICIKDSVNGSIQA